VRVTPLIEVSTRPADDPVSPRPSRTDYITP
jgi:hypothetical protein